MSTETTTNDFYDITLLPGGAPDPRLQWKYTKVDKHGSTICINQLVIQPTGPGSITFRLMTTGYHFSEDYKPVITGNGCNVITGSKLSPDRLGIELTVAKDPVAHDKRKVHILLIVVATDGSIHASPDPTVDPQNDGCSPPNDTQSE